MAGVRVRAGGARRGRGRGHRARRVHQLHLRRLVAGLRGGSCPGWSSGGPLGRAWITEFAGDGPAAIRPVRRVRPSGPLRWADGRLPRGLGAAVAEAVRRMRAGALDKAALAHDRWPGGGAAGPPLPAPRPGPALPLVWSFAVEGGSGRPRSCCCGAAGRRVVAGAGGDGVVGGGRAGGPADAGAAAASSERTGGSTRWPSSRWPRHSGRCARSSTSARAGGAGAAQRVAPGQRRAREAGPRRPPSLLRPRRGGAPDGSRGRHAGEAAVALIA